MMAVSPSRGGHRQRADRVAEQPQHVGALASDEIADLAADQDERRGHERLECNRRLHTTDSRVEILDDRRDRHVHQRRVDDEHEHRHRQQDGQARVARRLLRRAGWCVLGHRSTSWHVGLRPAPTARARRGPLRRDQEPRIASARRGVEVRAFGRVVREREGALERDRRLVGSSQPDEQLATGGVEQVVAVEIECVDREVRRGRPFQLGECDGAVERDHRCRAERVEVVVQREHLAPVGLGNGRRVTVHRVDRGLQSGTGRVGCDGGNGARAPGPRRSAPGPTSGGPGRPAAPSCHRGVGAGRVVTR